MEGFNIDKFEKSLFELFKYEDNSPNTYTQSCRLQETLKSFVFNPVVKLKRITHERLALLLHLGEYIYGYEGKPDQAMLPFEQAVDLASRLYPTLNQSKELA